MIWVYGADGLWEKTVKEPIVEGQPDTNRTRNPPRLPAQPQFLVGDAFDDADPLATPRIFSAANASTLGEPNRLRGYQQVSTADDAQLRKGLAIAKLKVERTRTAVSGAVHASRSGPFNAGLSAILELAFNIDGPTLNDERHRLKRLHILEILEHGVDRLLTGLTSEALPLISATRMRMYGLVDKPADCSGWVFRGITEARGRGDQLVDATSLKAVSGDIHLKSSELGNPNFVADTIIHEATHKFLGTWDYSYIGVQGSVATRLNQRAAELQGANERLDPAAARQRAKDEFRNRAFADLVKAVVAKGLKPELPEARNRGQDIRPADSPSVKAAKQVWARVRGWGPPPGRIPDTDNLERTIDDLLREVALPSSAKGELRDLKADKVKFLAEHGNDLGVKSHDVLFALPMGFLLKNADSWAEFAVTAGA